MNAHSKCISSAFDPYEFLLWFRPTIERPPRTQRFLFKDLVTRLARAIAVVSLAATIYFIAFGSGVKTQAQDAAAMRSQLLGVMYSNWHGGCSVSEIADISCAMREEARLVSGELLGFVIFGHGERSRFLIIGMIHPRAKRPFVIKIDGQPIAKRPFKCDNESRFCSIVLLVSPKLLRIIMKGSLLTFEVQNGMRLHFPLREFSRASQTIL